MAGGLISYAASLPDAWRRVAGLVDKILRGPAPGICRLSGRRSSSWWSTSRLPRMGLTVPEPFLLLADEVIE